MSSSGKPEIEAAYDGLEKEVPDRVARWIHWLRDPKARWVRWPVGLLLIFGSFLWFLPIIGLEWLPIGLLLIAQDVPFLRKPVGRMMLALESAWRRLERWWKERRRR
ncbi:hypothetical protein HLB44_01540 [Aquincola sp. S2]|uniref:Tryptophan synthase subunit beta n=1 Tax=Pseudaquabacterium terrae TaxID=2732868 RepID=A0ABX2EAU5_9BURK|nr:hypothetical protein [Aquabacterium terrae]NRF65658.1 hypothetical protein [Aquabacterium terrae]